MQKIQIPTGEPVGRVTCNKCGNSDQFVEIAENVLVTTSYIQNGDGSFTPEDNDTEIYGDVKFICGKCGQDLSQYHSHFLEMSF